MPKQLFIILTIALLWHGDVCRAGSKLYSTDGVIRYSDGRRSSKSSFYFPAGHFAYSLFWNNENEAARVGLGFAEGTFGHYHDIRPAHFWSPDGWTPYPHPTALWLNNNRDGSDVGQLTLSGFSQNVGGALCSFTYRFRALKEYPNWVFLRVTFEGAFPSLTFKFDSGWTDFVPPNAQGAGRYLYLNGEHYPINGPKPLPRDAAFDGFALYSRNSPKLDRDMSVLLFDRGNADMVSIDSMPNSTLAFLFNIRQAKPVSPDAQRRGLVFAMGNLPVSDGKNAAERFYRDGEDKRIREVLQSMDWGKVEIDDSVADAELRKAAARLAEGVAPKTWAELDPFDSGDIVGELVSELTTPDARMRLDAMRSALAAAKEAKDYDVYFKTLKELKRINREMAKTSLEKLLDAQ